MINQLVSANAWYGSIRYPRYSNYFTIKGYHQRDLVPSFSIHIQHPRDDKLKS